MPSGGSGTGGGFLLRNQVSTDCLVNLSSGEGVESPRLSASYPDQDSKEVMSVATAHLSTFLLATNENNTTSDRPNTLEEKPPPEDDINLSSSSKQKKPPLRSKDMPDKVSISYFYFLKHSDVS